VITKEKRKNRAPIVIPLSKIDRKIGILFQRRSRTLSITKCANKQSCNRKSVGESHLLDPRGAHHNIITVHPPRDIRGGALEIRCRCQLSRTRLLSRHYQKTIKFDRDIGAKIIDGLMEDERGKTQRGNIIYARSRRREQINLGHQKKEEERVPAYFLFWRLK
jgi:hypothetical protein